MSISEALARAKEKMVTCRCQKICYYLYTDADNRETARAKDKTKKTKKKERRRSSLRKKKKIQSCDEKTTNVIGRQGRMSGSEKRRLKVGTYTTFPP